MAGSIPQPRLPAPFGKGPLDPYGIMPSGFNVDPAAFGPYYGPAMRDILSLLQVNMPGIAGARASTGIADPAGANYQSTLAAGKSNMASRGLTGSGPERGMVSAALGQLGGARAQAAGAGATASMQAKQAMQQQVLQQLAAIAAQRAQSQAAGQSLNMQQQEAQFANQMLQREWPIITGQGNITNQLGIFQNAQWPFLSKAKSNAQQLLDLANQGADLSFLSGGIQGGLNLLTGANLSSFFGSGGSGGFQPSTFDPNANPANNPYIDWSQLSGFGFP